MFNSQTKRGRPIWSLNGKGNRHVDNKYDIHMRLEL